MERLCDLLFELSNEDRLNIMNLLMDEPLILSHISKRLGFSVQETSRNISRLTDTGLITRDAEGLYNVTSIVVTHDMKCVKKVSDRIVILEDGDFIARGTYDELVDNENETVRNYFI